jgi:hypothetical protein
MSPTGNEMAEDSRQVRNSRAAETELDDTESMDVAEMREAMGLSGPDRPASNGDGTAPRWSSGPTDRRV